VSNAAITRVLDKSKSKGTARLVLLILADYANEDGTAWPSTVTIAQKANTTKRNVLKTLSILEKEGEITRLGTGMRGVIKYHITVATGELQDTSEPQYTSEPEDTTTGEPQYTRTGELQDTQPLTKPLLTPQREGAKKGKSNGTRLDEDWRPDERDIAYAREQGIDAGREFEKFQNYWLSKAGSAARKVDWSRTWRNWCLRAAEDRGGVSNTKRGANGGKGGSQYERMHQAAGRVVAERASERGAF
jgi:hypothetical protein